MAEADVPLLLVFYEPMSELSTLFIPLLEEMAIEFDGRIEIILADIEKQSELADSFSVETLPQFSIVDEAVLKRSLIGFDDEAALKLRELVESYIDT
jgi:thioredoxin 1